MLTKKPTSKKAENRAVFSEPKSAHSTTIVENYVEQRKEKAKKQSNQENQRASFAMEDWKRLEYVIF